MTALEIAKKILTELEKTKFDFEMRNYYLPREDASMLAESYRDLYELTGSFRVRHDSDEKFRAPYCPHCDAKILEADAMGSSPAEFKMSDRSTHVVQMLFCTKCGGSVGSYLIGVKPPGLIVGR